MPRPSSRRGGPPRGVLRRERRALVRRREEAIRDLGGLILEMYRQDRFREELVAEQCAELMSIDERIQELDHLLSPDPTSVGIATAGSCACGAPLLAGAHFCANCGRATADAPVIVCAHCAQPLPADAKYCGACGNIALPVELEAGAHPLAGAARVEASGGGNGGDPGDSAHAAEGVPRQTPTPERNEAAGAPEAAAEP